MSRDYSYRNLIVWQRAQELSLAIMNIVQRIPRTWANAVIVRQIVASTTSIGANIAEGHGRFALGAHRNHLSIARGSAAETDSWLDLLRRSNWISADEEAPLHEECEQIMAMLTSKMRELDRLATDKGQLRESGPEYHLKNSFGSPMFPFSDEDYVSQ
jgi:four helix bundle protein